MSFGTEEEATTIVVEPKNERQSDALPMRREENTAQVVTYERAQIDAQIATAKAYPRSIQQFLTNCTAAATCDREIAESLFYAVPVGKEQGRQRYVEGPSIRLAELVAANYKNLHMETGIQEEGEKAVVAYAVVMDAENNVARKFCHSESIMGQYGRYSDRQIEKIKEVAQSKALRKAIFTVVPVALVKPIIKAAKSVIAGGKTLEQRRGDLMKWFASLKIDMKRIWGALGINGEAEITDAIIQEMTGLYNAIKNGETTVDYAFPPIARFGQGAEEDKPKGKMPLFRKSEEKKTDEAKDDVQPQQGELVAEEVK